MALGSDMKYKGFDTIDSSVPVPESVNAVYVMTHQEFELCSTSPIGNHRWIDVTGFKVVKFNRVVSAVEQGKCNFIVSWCPKHVCDMAYFPSEEAYITACLSYSHMMVDHEVL